MTTLALTIAIVLSIVCYTLIYSWYIEPYEMLKKKYETKPKKILQKFRYKK